MLDDDNSDRYTDADDLIPAMNSTFDYLTAVFSAAFEQKKVQPEVLSELITIYIYDPAVTGGTAKVDLDTPVTGSIVFNDIIWTLLGVDPNPTVVGTDFSESTLRFAKRFTLKEWNYALEDPFAPGTGQVVPTDFQRVCYTGPGNYFQDDSPYLLLRPGTLFSATTARVGVWLLKKHTTITANTDEVLFPVNLHGLIVQKMLFYISYQNANPRLSEISDKDLKELIQLMNM